MYKLSENPYIQEILSQPAEIEHLLGRLDLASLAPLAAELKNGAFDRLILTGMGASLYAMYTAWISLVQAGLPAFWIDNAELLHYSGSLITPRSLLWILSQSGRSAEVQALVGARRRTRPARILGTTNDLSSPLAQAADISLTIDATVEKTVSTRTYLNSLAAIQLTALALTGIDFNESLAQLKETAVILRAYLEEIDRHVEELRRLVPYPRHLAILGRGPSLASALTGGLILGEASKFPVMTLNAAEFRHGPLELAGPELTVLIFAGPQATRELNHHLAVDLQKFGARVFWLNSEPDDQLPTILIPATPQIGLPLAEILPIQLMTIAFAESAGYPPGQFRYSRKITLTE